MLSKSEWERAVEVHSNEMEYCCLHIVLSDGNVEDHHIEFSRARAERDGCQTCLELSQIMLKMTLEERTRFVEDHHHAW